MRTNPKKVPAYVQDFEHEPLDRSTPSIRLLRIVPGSEEVPFRCELKHGTVHCDYVCLSYMWGNDEPSHVIEINGQPLKVRRNLFDFLLIARRLDIKDWLWIDAICIDQANTIERNHQVQQMADIYRRARHVLIYAGHISKFMRIRIALNWSYLKRWPVSRIDVESDSDSDDDKPETATTIFRQVRLATTPTFFRTFAHSILVRSFVESFASLPYFERMWIIQELGLAQARFLVTGSRLIHWWHIETFLYSSRKFGCNQPVLNTHSYFPRRGGAVTWDTFKTILRLSKDCKCANVRDHIYGLLGLLDPPLPLDVDYDVDPGDLLLDVITCAYEQKRDQTFGEFWTFVDIVQQALGVRLSLLCGQACKPQKRGGHLNRSSDNRSVVTVSDAQGNLLSRNRKPEALFPSLLLFGPTIDKEQQSYFNDKASDSQQPRTNAPKTSPKLYCQVCAFPAPTICIRDSDIEFSENELEGVESMTDEQLEQFVFDKVAGRDFSLRKGLKLCISKSAGDEAGGKAGEEGETEARNLPCLEIVLRYPFTEPAFLPVAH